MGAVGYLTKPATHAELATRMGEIRAAACTGPGPDGEPLETSLTFFEIATALGLLHFAYRRIDWAVLEVGLGGRLDSTNAVMPAASVITSISFDHVELLGSTLAAIAHEKAGIIKPDRPTVSGVAQDEARSVIAARCREIGAPLRQLGRDFHYRYEPARVEANRPGRVSVTTWRGEYPELILPLVGEHQAANAAVAVATLETLRERGVPIPDRSIAKGLSSVRWPARLEVVGRDPLIVLDCAHNVASAEALRDALLTSFRIPGERVLVFAVSRDKDAAGILRVLHPIFRHVILTRFEKSARYVPPEQLREMLPGNASVAATPVEAIAAARAMLGPDDLLCVTGSVFLAGEVRPLLLHA